MGRFFECEDYSVHNEIVDGVREEQLQLLTHSLTDKNPKEKNEVCGYCVWVCIVSHRYTSRAQAVTDLIVTPKEVRIPKNGPE